MFTFVFRNKRFNFKINIAMEQNSKIVLFQEKSIRRLWYNEEWVYNVADVLGVLTDSRDAKGYWRQLKKRMIEKEGGQYYNILVPVKMLSTDGKYYKADCASTKNILRIIMSVPSPKAQSIKFWMAEVGEERLGSISIPMLIMSHSQLNENTPICEFKTYLMHDSQRGYYKIGKSRNPKVRETTLQAELPTIDLIHVIDSDIELYLHQKFDAKRVRGEWFRLSQDDINYIKKY